MSQIRSLSKKERFLLRGGTWGRDSGGIGGGERGEGGFEYGLSWFMAAKK